ncbi:toxin-activating lysine-acyltransferase, partial [Salmonella enterica]|nr:toxin-activating lysine-acyltransferase [Salmonella enterica]
DLGYISSWLFNALDHNQIHIEFHSGLPVFFFSWAYLSESVVARYLYYNYTLDWSEWYEGELLWIIDLCSIIPFTQEDIINTLCSCFPEKKYIYWNSMPSHEHRVYRLDIRNRKISFKNRDEFIEALRY